MHIQMLTILLAVFWFPANTGAEPLDNSNRQLLAIVNDPELPCEVRTVAEHQLVANSHNVETLPHLFTTLGQPVGRWQHPNELFTISRIPGTGSPETDCRLLGSAEAQIVYARIRIWNAFARNGEPAGERKRIYAELFDEVTTEFQVRQLIYKSRRNWTSEVRQRLLAVYEDAQWMPHTRRSVVHTIYDMHHTTPRAEQVQLREQLTAIAWNERGTEFSRLVAGTLGRDGHPDPRVAALRVDLYLHESIAARHRLPLKNNADLIEQYFGNITGLYIAPRSAEANRRFIEQRDKRFELREEARETGNDTKLRDFEAELAERQQQELELRIERINAWIEENRERIEHEAAEYAAKQE